MRDLILLNSELNTTALTHISAKPHASSGIEDYVDPQQDTPAKCSSTAAPTVLF